MPVSIAPPDTRASTSEASYSTSYKVGLKTLYYANTDDGKSDTTENEQDNDCAGGACKL